jgi:menaquinone-specific isochorismate synthase
LSLYEALSRARAAGPERERGPVAIGGTLDLDPDACLATAKPPWCFWDTRSSASLGPEVVLGLGAFTTLTARGTSRFGEVARSSERLFESLRVVGEGPTARLFGGFAFSPNSEGPFGDACFVLPRLIVEADRALLVLDESELDRGKSVLESLLAVSVEPRSAKPYVLDDGSSSYLGAVRRALAAIATGDVEKVVTARKVRIGNAPLAREALGALRGTPGSTRLGLCTTDGAFIAATPELLCAVDDTAIRTEALAGTIPADLPASQLSGSEKDCREQAHVVRGITAAFARLGIEPTAESASVRALRHVQHLVTPITARRPPSLHVLDLVEALHPTPAVGGVPCERALAFLEELEPGGRGPYAGPFGWLDARGRGTFVVGIRSALFQKQQVDVFAGGGIVRGSDPERELRETDWKLRGLFGALGGVT